ncbi:MAG: hypothetical protein KGQ60_12510, partial [Planctomycetes bacterium]|nr:hypothetical protein [Planctomycetota bacterium]
MSAVIKIDAGLSEIGVALTVGATFTPKVALNSEVLPPKSVAVAVRLSVEMTPKPVTFKVPLKLPAAS